MKKTLSLLLALTLVVSLFAAVGSASAASLTAGEQLKAIGVIKGDTSGSLNETSTWDKQDLAVLLSRLAGKEEVAAATAKSHTFADVADDYYDGYISWAKAAGYITGVSATEFGFNEPVTYKVLNAVILRVLGYDTTGANYDTTEDLAVSVGLSEATDFDAAAIRGIAYGTILKALETNVKGTEKSLGLTLGIKSFVDAAAEKAAAEAAAAKPQVVSVTAINAKQIQVVFNQAFDKTSVTDVTKYSVKSAGSPAITLSATASAASEASAALSADGKTLTITLINALTSASFGNIAEGDTFNFTIGKIKNAAGVEIAAQTKVVSYSDKVAPTFVSATAKAKEKTTSVVLTFSEPVSASVATATVNGSGATISAGASAEKLVLTANADLLVNKSYAFTILNVKDIAGNLIATNPVTGNVTVEADTSAPTVTSVDVTSDKTITVVFDKSIDATTISNTSVSLRDVNLTTTDITVTSNGAVANTDNKKFTFDVVTPFTTTGTFTGTLVFANTIKDSLGNALVATTKPVVITKDTVKPTIVSATHKNVSTYNTLTTTNGAIVIKFTEAVSASAATNAYTVLNQDGGTVSSAFSARTINPNDSTELVLTLNSALATTDKSFFVVVPAGAVNDKAQTANASEGKQIIVDVTAGAPVVTDTTAPTLSLGTVTAATSLTSGTTIAVSITESGSGLDLATVLNTNNYTLNGVALPAGSYISYASGTATINIPAGSFAEDKTYTLNVFNIKDKAGNSSLTLVNNSVSLKDDIAPELKTAVLNSNGTVTIGFSESVVAAANGAADIAVTVNGSLLTGTNKAYTITDGSGSEAGKYLVTVKKASKGYAATSGTLSQGGRTFTGTSNNVITITFIDVDGDQAFSASDILISSVDTGATTAVNFSDSTAFNLNDASGIKVGTIASPTVLDDTIDSSLTNIVVGSKTITVK